MKKCSMRITVLLVCMAMLLTGCSKSSPNGESELSFVAGEYEIITKGHNGDMTVVTVFSENAIEEITVKDHIETASIAGAPIEKIPAFIVENQSLKIDAITGATVTSDAIISAVSEAVVNAKGDLDALKNKEVAIVSRDAVEKTADVIVVGGGGAGLTAAISAAEDGASVIIIEKTSSTGGNSVRTAGYYSAPITDLVNKHEMNESQRADIDRLLSIEPADELMASWQAKVSDDMKAYDEAGSTYLYDSNEFTCLQYKDRFGAGVSTTLLSHMIDLSDDTYYWLQDYVGLNWNEESVSILGDNWPRWHNLPEYKSGEGFIKVFEEIIVSKDLDIEIIKDVAGNELIVEDDVVVGVKAIHSDNTEYTLNANTGVILATGGFSASVELREKYNTKWVYVGEDLPSTNNKAMQGDGLVMALELGADVIDIDHYQFMPLADETGDVHGLVGDSQGLFINKEGNRFVNEGADRTVIVNSILNQTDKGMFLISSKMGCGLDENGYNSFGAHIDSLIEKGAVLKADTLEELAKLMGVDEAVFLETVKTHNENVQNELDSEFGKTIFREKSIIEETGPYYASWKKPAIHITKGGILVNTSEQVVNTDGEIISGLYAAGEVTGGRGPSGLLEAFTTGYNAGKQVLN